MGLGDLLSTQEALAKLSIRKLPDEENSGGTGGSSGGEEFSVQFNPQDYSQSYEIEWEEQQADGDTDAVQSFKRIKTSELSLTVMIDGTGASVELDKTVKEKIDELLNLAYNYKGEEHKPNRLKVIWGTLDFEGVLQSLNVSYTLFSPDGNPLRAKLDLGFASHKAKEKQEAENRSASPDLTHQRTIRDGDSLPILCFEIYGDEQYYQQVAAYNGLTNYRNLETGQKIYFPPLKEVNA